MIYTTTELIQILEEELRANWKGERILLSSAARLAHPVIEAAMDMRKVGKVFAYQDFRHQIHAYQQKYQVSGIIWRSIDFQGKSVLYPEVHNQLIAIAGDKETLIAAKKSVLSFWREVTPQMKLWLACDRESREKITLEVFEDLASQAEWAELDATRTELYLGLCWGNPKEYQYLWAKPTSGCHRIVAAINEPSSIRI
ncbi:MAG: hypothetical protein DSM107014_09325 [Gomphosphaeria aponina SAG 52.96 = DSM 107014]|uniref:Uncharacterized protein n=1 Tax=Gomphosphaeria aponina SAG 52.96 = DSM 107014 TaxID=1521640 RepID=A0A941JV24_9CHRO|nr:hypothetical protein [Gomphosphaeria aponina SAG 52.96 = DSM 107014]